MAAIIHPATGLLVGDPEKSPFAAGRLPTSADVAAAASDLILSASGWRKVFAAADPAAPRAPWARPHGSVEAAGRDEDSLSAGVDLADLVLAGAMARTFVEYLRERSGRPDPALLVGIDGRPTGPALADAMCRVFLGLGARPRYLYIVAAPELMAYSRRCSLLGGDQDERVEGFCYISASHNPPAHNGVKFGTGGGVLPGGESGRLIEAFRSIVAAPDIVESVVGAAAAAEPREIAALYSGVSALKRKSISAYTLFAREVATGRPEPERQEELFDEMERGARARPVGVVAELNGSARCLSIDADFLEGIGVRTMRLNAEPRQFAHRIVPEGESLEDCRRALEKAHAEDPAFVVGYVPDCDGDRGNLVIWDEGLGRGRGLMAQEGFALCCVAECAQLAREGRLGAAGRAAIAVNDATSMRIEEIGEAFGVEVHRAETGEANVVGLAEELRAQGCLVRILGEGSNGGNITQPSAVRDPLATLSALLKLLLIRSAGPGTASAAGVGGAGANRAVSTIRADGLFDLWLARRGGGGKARPDFGLADIIASLPRYATTSAFEPRAMLKIRSTDHAALKDRYKAVFLEAWARDREEFSRRLGVTGWKAFASRGSHETPIGEDFASSGRGGLRIVLSTPSGAPKAFVWMRGSGTEPVFRVMADIAGGSEEDEEWLLGWHRFLVAAADGR